VVPEGGQSHELSVALRIAHDLNTYHRLDAEIITSSQAFQLFQHNSIENGNFIVIGGAQSSFTESILAEKRTPFTVQGGTLKLCGRPVLNASQGTFSYARTANGPYLSQCRLSPKE